MHCGGLQRYMIKTLFTRVGKMIFGLDLHHHTDEYGIDIKANNIFVNRNDDGQEVVINQVQLGDLEDAAHVPPGSHIIGTQAGNYM
jgi:hypothetical protein